MGFIMFVHPTETYKKQFVVTSSDIIEKKALSVIFLTMSLMSHTPLALLSHLVYLYGSTFSSFLYSLGNSSVSYSI